MAEAFGYFDENGINVDTVCSTVKAVKINVIVLASYGNVVPQPAWTNDDVDLAFHNATGNVGRILALSISVRGDD